MIVRIFRGIGSPGKLWTGDTPDHGEIVHAVVREHHCACGATTARLRVKKDAVTLFMIEKEDLKIPTLLVTMGGVGSLVSTQWDDPYDRHPLQCWNWSGRVGGHVVLNPLTHVGGRFIEESALPVQEDGWWMQTYQGQTLVEWVLCRTSSHGDSVHALPREVREGVCPPCQEKARAAAFEAAGTSPHFAAALAAMRVSPDDVNSAELELLSLEFQGEQVTLGELAERHRTAYGSPWELAEAVYARLIEAGVEAENSMYW